MPIVFYVSNNPGPWRQVAQEQVQRALPFAMQLLAPKRVVLGLTPILNLPHVPILCCWCSNDATILYVIGKKCICTGVPEIVGIIVELYKRLALDIENYVRWVVFLPWRAMSSIPCRRHPPLGTYEQTLLPKQLLLILGAPRAQV